MNHFYEDYIAPALGFCVICYGLFAWYNSCQEDKTSETTVPTKYSAPLKSTNGSSSSSSSHKDYNVPAPSNSYEGSGNYNNNSYDNSSSNYQKPERRWRDCSLCKGKGRVIRDSSIPVYGNDHQVYCNECNRSYWASTGHAHVRCPTCGGKGGFWSE